MTSHSRIVVTLITASLLFPLTPQLAKADFSYIPYNGVMARVLHKNNMRAIYARRGQSIDGAPIKAASATPSGVKSGNHVYRVDDEVSRRVKAEFLSRLSETDRSAARKAQRAIEQYDSFKIYRDITRPFGLKMRNPVDSMTAYMLLSWMIANDSPDPSRRQVAAARSDVAQALDDTLGDLSAEEVQTLDEELMYRFVITHAGWRSAVEREGPAALRRLSDSLNASWQAEFNNDLRGLRLTATDGFVER